MREKQKLHINHNSHFKCMHFYKTNKSGTMIHVHFKRDSIPRLGYFPKKKNDQERNEKDNEGT